MKRLVANLLYKELSYKAHGAAIEVRKALGPGHKEKLYQQAFAEELKSAGLAFEKEKAVKIYSPKSGKYLGLYRPDFVIDKKIIVEIKAEKFVSRGEINRIYDYLRNSDYELAYLVNFASPRLFVRRIIYTNDRKPFMAALSKKLLVSIGLILVFIGGLYTAHAAQYSLYFSAPTSTIAVGSEFAVKILADSDQPLNAYAVSFSYPIDKLALLGFDDSKSVINIWQGRPAVYEDGLVTFRGGSLTPWRGTGGEVLTARFRAVREGAVELPFSNSSVYLANGKGTKVAPQLESLKLQIAAASPSQISSGESGGQAGGETADTTPPEIKYLSLIDDPLNGSQKLLSFMVSDPESGVASTFMRARSFLFWSDWAPAQNPTAVPLSVWSVGFRATDNSGNIAERTFYNPAALLQPAALVVAAAVIILLVVGFIALKSNKGRSYSTNIH